MRAKRKFSFRHLDMLKAPLVSPGTPVVNALAKQRTAMENIFRACVGLAPTNDMMLEHKVWKQ